MCTSESPPCPFFAAHCHSARSYYRSVFACVGRRFHGPRQWQRYCGHSADVYFRSPQGPVRNSEIRRVRSENSTIAVSGFVTFPDEMGRPATNKRVRTKPAAKPKDGSEKGAGKQPAKKKTASGGARVALNVPHVAADKPHEEGRAATVLDRAVLLPRHLVPLSVIGLAPSPRAHDMRMRMSICASPNGKTMRRCAPACVSWQRDQSLIRVADRGRCSPITTN